MTKEGTAWRLCGGEGGMEGKGEQRWKGQEVGWQGGTEKRIEGEREAEGGSNSKVLKFLTQRGTAGLVREK